MQVLGVDGRRFGTALVAFGVVGVILAGAVAVALVLGGLSVRSLADDLEADRLALVESLESASGSMGNAATSTANAQETLGSTETAIRDANETLADLATSVDSLAGALDFEVLGQQPLAGAAASFAGLADTIRGFSDDLDAIAVDLVANQDDLERMAEGLRDLETRLTALATRVAAFDRTDEFVAMAAWSFVLLGAVAAWIAAAGALIAWVGWRLRQIAATGTPPDHP